MECRQNPGENARFFYRVRKGIQPRINTDGPGAADAATTQGTVEGVAG